MKARLVTLLLTFAFSIAYLSVVSADGPIRDSSSNAGTNEVRRFEVTGPWGGDVRSLVCSPDNPELLYLGTSDGQIFRSTDGSQTWRRLRPGLGRRGLSVDNIVIDPHDPKIIYCGVWAVAHGEEGGVFKSEDAGEHWKLLEKTKKLSIRSLAVAPQDSNFLIAGSANDDPKLNGVYRSTDAGDNWERISPEGDKEIHNIESVAIDPRDANIVYIGTWHLPWKTTDGGANWKQTGYQNIGMINDSDIFGIKVNPTDPNLVYMHACSGIYRSQSAGQKWLKMPGIPFSARRTYALLAHPTQPNIIFAGTSEGLWRTKDGGKRWMLLTSKNVVIRSIVVHPEKPSRVLIATDAFGIRISENLGNDFADANTGFIHRHILSILPDQVEHGRILASVFHDGTAGSVFVSTDSGENWQLSSHGLGGRDVFSFFQMPDKPDLIYAGTNTGVYRSTDRGANWSSVSEPITPEKKPVRRQTHRGSRGRRASAPAASGTRAAGVTASTANAGAHYEAVTASQRRRSTQKRAPKKKEPEVAQPVGPVLLPLTKQVDDIATFVDADGNRGLLAATMDGLYKTMDETKGWEKITIAGYDADGRVFSVSTHKDTPKRVFVGTRLGLFISSDGCATWEHVDRGPSDMTVKAIAQDPRDQGIVLLGTNQFIFRSTNGGRTWVRRGGGLPAGDFTSVVINPANPDEVLVAEYSHGGIYRSTDKGYNWERIDDLAGTELPTNRVWTLTFDPFEPDKIYAGSFSSGVYVLTIQRTATAPVK